MAKREPIKTVRDRIEFEESLNENERLKYEIAFQAAQRSNSHHYKGIYPHFREIIDAQNETNKRLDNMELLLKALIK